MVKKKALRRLIDNKLAATIEKNCLTGCGSKIVECGCKKSKPGFKCASFFSSSSFSLLLEAEKKPRHLNPIDQQSKRESTPIVNWSTAIFFPLSLPAYVNDIYTATVVCMCIYENVYIPLKVRHKMIWPQAKECKNARTNDPETTTSTAIHIWDAA